MNESHFFGCTTDSPVGAIRLVASDEGLACLYFRDHRHARNPRVQEVAHHPVLDRARHELDEYFAGRRTRFETPLAPYAMARCSEFRLAVWSALRAIPFGETRSYRDIARVVERPDAVRAVGTANGVNPISIFVPCHRVIAGDGSLAGYGGGLDVKRWLLDHESRRRGGERLGRP